PPAQAAGPPPLRPIAIPKNSPVPLPIGGSIVTRSPAACPPQAMPAAARHAWNSLRSNARADTGTYFSTQSAQRGTSTLPPHGMIGTDDVEFFGEPSMRRSE